MATMGAFGSWLSNLGIDKASQGDYMDALAPDTDISSLTLTKEMMANQQAALAQHHSQNSSHIGIATTGTTTGTGNVALGYGGIGTTSPNTNLNVGYQFSGQPPQQPGQWNPAPPDMPPQQPRKKKKKTTPLQDAIDSEVSKLK